MWDWFDKTLDKGIAGYLSYFDTKKQIKEAEATKAEAELAKQQLSVFDRITKTDTYGAASAFVTANGGVNVVAVAAVAAGAYFLWKKL